jgi:cobalt-zinc-cadmium efflux system membrane fusion protein
MTQARLCTAVVIVLLLSLGSVAFAGDDEGGEEHEHGEEGDIEFLDPESLERAGITFLNAGPQTITVTLPLNGTIVPHEDRVTRIIPRYPGIVREVRKRLGDPVAKGEVVAVVESNQSLGRYEVRSELEGFIARRDVTVGEFTADTAAIFEVADYRVLFADFFVFSTDLGKVRVGQKVSVEAPGDEPSQNATISFISPVTDVATQSRFARAVLENPRGRYQPGMFVTGEVVLDSIPVPIAVQKSAVRTSKGESIVFIREGERIEPRAVVIGRADKEFAEVVSGVTPGEAYAAGKTFVLLSELEKGEAEHED